jgi:hypothetical protein
MSHEYFTSNTIKSSTRSNFNTSNKSINPVLTYNLGVCSKNCCTNQWPVNINVTENSRIKPEQVGKGKMYSTSNLTCNDGVNNTGCVCLTKKSRQLLNKRGYVKNIPLANGLLNADNKPSGLNLANNKNISSFKSDDFAKLINTSTNNYNKNLYNETNKTNTIKSEKELARRYSMPINNNLIDFNDIENMESYSEINLY